MVDFDPVIVLFLLIWLTFFGACIGSFLNVVIYRLPRGKNLSKPPSHCPKCHHPIRWYDNVPVFGWLLLRGKCRDCKEPISVRYPVVEALCGGIFGTIASLTLQRNSNASIMETVTIVSALSGLVVTFLAAGFIEQEKKIIPLKLFIPVTILAPIMLYLTHLIKISFHLPMYTIECFVNIVISLIVSGFCSVFIYNDKKQRIVWIVTAIFLGIYLGSAGLVIILSASLLSFLLRLLSRQNVLTPLIILTFTTFLGIILILFF
jgi:leader peptidase (prepilin peptidase)/N-methyltransferase